MVVLGWLTNTCLVKKLHGSVYLGYKWLKFSPSANEYWYNWIYTKIILIHHLIVITESKYYHIYEKTLLSAFLRFFYEFKSAPVPIMTRRRADNNPSSQTVYYMLSVMWGLSQPKDVVLPIVNPIMKIRWCHDQLERLVHNRCNTAANVMELHFSCTNPPILIFIMDIHTSKYSLYIEIVIGASGSVTMRQIISIHH